MPTKDQTEFPAAEQSLREARDRCAKACSDYNSQPDPNDHVARSALYNAIINSSTSTCCASTVIPKCIGQTSQNAKVVSPLVSPINHETISGDVSAANFSAVPESALVSPLSLVTGPVIGSSPDAAAHDPSVDSCQSAASPPVFTAARRFPGQGLAPFIKPPLYMDYGSNVDIGTSTFINRGCKILDTPVRVVRIGERCSIGPDFSVYAVSHPLDYRLRQGKHGAPSYGLDVIIGDDCWIGGHVTILGGVTIGDGCTIGANSLVTKDIPAGYLAYGSPARSIRRVDEEEYASMIVQLFRALSTFTSHNWLRSPSRRAMTSMSTLAVGLSVCTAAMTFAIHKYLQTTAAG